MNVLIAEDDACLRQALAAALAQRGWVTQTCHDGPSVLRLCDAREPDVLTLDLGLPGLDGLAVLARLRAMKSSLPVLVLTARGAVGDRVQALNAGADDYLCKPCDLDELSARLHALVRRVAHQRAAAWTCGELRLELDSGAFYIGERILSLTPREQAFVRALMARQGSVTTKDRLFREVFAFGSQALPQALDVVAHRVRRKLAGAGADIVTVRGLGYLLRHEPLTSTDATARPGGGAPAGSAPG